MVKKNTPNWSNVKTKMVDFDRAGLIWGAPADC